MSLNIATSGLDAVSKKLESISDNIANASTVGFKSARTEFAAMYAAAQPLGVRVSRVSQSINKGGNLIGSEKVTDLAISGNGFFIVRDPSGARAFTRAGYFDTGVNGYLNNNGLRLQGYGVDADGTVQTGKLTDLKITNGPLTAKATDSVEFTANLKAGEAPPTVAPFDQYNPETYNCMGSITVHDSLGSEHKIDQYFVKSATANQWAVYYCIDDKPQTATTDLKFDTHGKLTLPTAAVALNYTPTGGTSTPAPLKIKLNYDGTRQSAADYSVGVNKPNGYATGNKTGISIDEQGSIYATYSNGERQLQGQVVLANFNNPNGLSPHDDTTWKETSSSGAMLTGLPNSGLFGEIKSARLEQSNVDLSSELVDLMTAQRNYQANTKVISTNDSMMNALFQAI